ncbi:MAG TPA: DUF4340 domain-containing protein, partial [Candidatus Synoicihabitans sp.]|nr:DUF4340 domain-containing protein [Candidatus Synoicihabitans sp.]
GQPLLSAADAEKAARLTIADEGKTVEVVRQPDGTWQVASFHQLPADFNKLTRFVKDLTEAKIERLVTRNPESIARLQFKDTAITLADAEGTEIWSVHLGKNAEGGGRFVRFGDEAKAYLSRLATWLDTTPRNWADSSLLAVKPEQVARFELSLPEGGSLIGERAKADEPFTAPGLPEGQQLRKSSVDAMLSSLTSLRFSDTTAPDDADAVAARAHERTVKLTTFDGATVTIALGRKPEQTVVKTAEPKPETSGPAAMVGSLTGEVKPEEAGPAKVAETTTETIPAGPVFAQVTGDPKLAKLSGAASAVAFKVSDYVFTSLPKSVSELTEPKPAPAPTPAPTADPAPAAEPTTPPAEAPAP